jgi:hypothetical protein
MKIAGILEAGIESGILTKAKYVQGGYIVAANPTEVATIPTGVLVDGYTFICIFRKQIL